MDLAAQLWIDGVVIILDAQMDKSMLTARNAARVSRMTNRIMMIEHKDSVLPKHFKNVPETRPGGAYQYEKRTKAYQKRKARKGHQKPLVLSGQLREGVLASARVTATQYGAKLLMRGTTKSPLSDKHREELEAVSDAEKEAMAKRWGETFLLLAQQPQYQRKERVRTAKGRFAGSK